MAGGVVDLDPWLMGSDSFSVGVGHPAPRPSWRKEAATLRRCQVFVLSLSFCPPLLEWKRGSKTNPQIAIAQAERARLGGGAVL